MVAAARSVLNGQLGRVGKRVAQEPLERFGRHFRHASEVVQACDLDQTELYGPVRPTLYNRTYPVANGGAGPVPARDRAPADGADPVARIRAALQGADRRVPRRGARV